MLKPGNPFTTGVPEPDREAVCHGGRRVGDLVPGGGEPAAHRGLQEEVPLNTQDVARPGMNTSERLCTKISNVAVGWRRFLFNSVAVMAVCFRGYGHVG